MIRYYYTLAELIDVEATAGFNQLFNNWLGTYTDTTNTKTLWDDISDRFMGDYVLYIDVKHFTKKPTIAEILDDDDLRLDVTNKMRKIRAWLNDSKFRYEKLVSLYTDNANNLMNQLTATSQFNDTPQTTETGLDGDAYATTYTVNKTDSGTVLQRLSEVRALWKSVMEEWCSEFSRKFVYYN